MAKGEGDGEGKGRVGKGKGVIKARKRSWQRWPVDREVWWGGLLLELRQRCEASALIQ